MRTVVLALGCIAAVGCGAMLARLSIAAPVLVLATLAITLVWLWVLADRSAKRRASWVVATSLLLAGLARGASVGPSEPPRVLERGWPSDMALRELEVVGASEPGFRCALELRDPRDDRGAVLEVSAPAESCPLAAGQRVAVPARALAGSWREALTGGERDLGRAPVIWLRPTPEPAGLQRIVVGYWHWVAALRQKAWESSRGDPSASLVVAIGLGLRSALSPDDRQSLRGSGLGHLIAVSGLHVAVAALWFSALARRGATMLGVSPRWACVIAWLPLWAYVGLTGAAASAVRAAVMVNAVDLATISGRPQHGPTVLACTAAGMLLWQPQWLVDPGFALSLCAMAAIVTAPSELGLLAMSWRVTWATAPVSVLCFDVAPLHGLIGNAFALPIFGLLMPLALLATLVPGPIGALAMSLAKLAAVPILDIAAILAELPSAGPALLLALGLASLLLRRWLEGRAWLPPAGACVLASVVAAVLVIDDAVDRRRSDPLAFDWVAMGSVHSRSLLVADASAPRSACLYRPTDTSATWLALFELLDVRRLGRVDAKLPNPDRPDHDQLDPGARALLGQLERAGIERGTEAACQPPDPAEVRAALRACQFRQGGRGRALARSHEGVISCRIDARWVWASELSDTDP